jgi:hypothetical protein
LSRFFYLSLDLKLSLNVESKDKAKDAVYQNKMGFLDCRELGIGRDDSVDDPEGSVFAIELTPGGFDKTNKLLSYAHYDFTNTEQFHIKSETLTCV